MAECVEGQMGTDMDVSVDSGIRGPNIKVPVTLGMLLLLPTVSRDALNKSKPASARAWEVSLRGYKTLWSGAHLGWSLRI